MIQGLGALQDIRDEASMGSVKDLQWATVPNAADRSTALMWGGWGLTPSWGKWLQLWKGTHLWGNWMQVWEVHTHGEIDCSSGKGTPLGKLVAAMEIAYP